MNAATARIRLNALRLRLAKVIPSLHPGRGPSRTLWPSIALSAALLIPWIASPILIPDTIEMLATGRCLLGLGIGDAVCESLDMGRYPVLFPVLSGIAWASGLAPTTAAILVGLIAACMACAMATATLQERGLLPAILMPAIMLAVPGVRAHLFAGDARGLMILGMLGASHWLMSDRKSGFILGGWLSMMILARPESVLAAAGLLLLTALRDRPAAYRALPLACGAWLLQQGVQTLGGGSRSWEAKVASLIKIIPDDWIFQLVGLGMGETAFRSRLVAADIPSTTSTTGAWEWLFYAIPTSIPAWLGAGAIIGLVAIIQRKEWRLLGLMAAWSCPAVVVLVAAQAREQVLPAANLLTLMTACCALSSVALARFLRWTSGLIFQLNPPGTMGLSAAGILICIGLSSKSTYVQTDRIMELGDAHAAAHRWVADNTHEETPIAVSFRSGGIALLARRPRVALPASWEARAWLADPTHPTHVVISSIDSPGTHATLQQMSRYTSLQLMETFTDDTTIIWIYKLEDA